MKVTRSVKCHFNKWLTAKKKQEIETLISNHSKIVNKFIEKYEEQIPEKRKFDLLKKECIHSTEEEFPARLIKNAFSEGYGMVLGAKRLAEKTKKKYVRPTHNGNKITLSETNAEISVSPETKAFDMNVTIYCIGNKQKISIPLKRNEQFNYLNSIGTLNKTIILSPTYVLFSFEIITDKKKLEGNLLGIDVGINNLLTDSNGNFYGQEYSNLIEKLNRKKKCSKAYYRAKEELKEFINRIIKLLPFQTLRLIVVEKLKNLKYKMKERRRLSKSIRRVVAVWNYRHALDRIESLCEINRVSFRSVPAYNTSVECSCCGHSDKKNRQSQELFVCQNCGHSENADVNAAKNILGRLIFGPYGAEFKPGNLENIPVPPTGYISTL